MGRLTRATGARHSPLPPIRRRRSPLRPHGATTLRARMVGAVLIGVLLAGLEAVPGGPPPAVAEAHANCDGTDHWHWKLWPWPHKERWVYVRSRSVDRHHYQNYFWNETEGYGDWSADCPS